MRGLLDADILAYEFGGLKDDSGEVIPLEFAIRSMHERIDVIKEKSGACSLEYYLTGKSNFRLKVATILPYKGHRKVEKPKHWRALRHELITNCNAVVVEGMEADDAVSIEQCKAGNNDSTCIISRDKDLLMVAGWHYGWEAGACKERPLHYISELEGLKSFYKQLLTGDKSVDNILGLFGVGKKSTLVSVIDKMENEEEMCCHVFDKYFDRFGTYAPMFMIENARLLWMLQQEEQVWQAPVDLDALLQTKLES